MTDNEIIKALECCILGDCQGCFYGDTDQRHCKDDLMQNALDLITRQKAEIERLQNDYLSMQSTLAKMSMGVEQTKVEAIQDYIDKVKYELYMTNGWDKNKIIFDILDSIYNKMVEANK